ncbi:MAG TPA: hypothetical protein VF691_05415 [Cytophagaceae bacterium]
MDYLFKTTNFTNAPKGSLSAIQNPSKGGFVINGSEDIIKVEMYTGLEMWYMKEGLKIPTLQDFHKVGCSVCLWGKKCIPN